MATEAPAVESVQKKPKFVIGCDFDGTLTDNRLTAKPFYENYRDAFFRNLASLDFRNIDFLPDYYKEQPRKREQRILTNNMLFDAALAEVYKDPGKRGWKKVDGHVVSAAESDPYQLAKAAAEELLDQLRRMPGFHVPEKDQYNKFLEPVFQEAHSKLQPIFREGAKEFIELFYGPSARDDIELVFVTNSKEASVRKKLAKLLEGTGIDHMKIRIKEDAEKEFIEENDFDKGIEVDGIPRTLFTERSKYARALEEIGADVAMGDNNELDGLVPLTRGLPFIFIDDTNQGPIVFWDSHASKPSVDVIAVMKNGLKKLYGDKYMPIGDIEEGEKRVPALDIAAIALLGLANAKLGTNT